MRATFTSVAAQADNLGDAEIRSVATHLVAASETELHVFLGRMPAAYVRCIDLPATARLYRSPARYGCALARAIVSGRANLVLSPGPYVVPRGPRAVRSLLMLVLVALVTGRGGAVVGVGRALHTGGASARIEAALARRCSLLVVRDPASAAVFGEPLLKMAPDLGLLPDRRPASAPERTRVVLSFRADRDVPDSFMNSLLAELTHHGLTPVLVSQVQRDDQIHRRLSEAWKIESALWGTNDHDVQMERVRVEMTQAAWVVTDRLHAAIFGVQCGASPVAAVRRTPDKLLNCLDSLLPLPVVDPDSTDSISAVPWASDDHHRRVYLAAARCRAQLDGLAADVARILDGSTNEMGSPRA